jgi:predicted AlkP superfamily phosphohydrolase/phosphomutase
MKLLIIGVDGMDRELSARFSSEMPVLTRMAREGVEISMRSIFPPDSTPAWATIYTGKTPANHGVINFINLGDKDGTYTPFKCDDSMMKGKTFWDTASAHGKKVCICLPFNIYPGWQVNGGMVCRNTSLNSPKHRLKAVPPSLLNFDVPPPSVLNMYHGFYSRNQLNNLILHCHARTEGEKALGLRLMKNVPWDLFFIYFSSLDGIQHYFWNYFDREHPNYPGENSFQDVIPKFYQLMDETIGELVEAAGEDTTILILSDHGHGMRPYRLFNMNEYLRMHGYLVTRKSMINSTKRSPNLRVQLRKVLYRIVRQYGASYLLMRLSLRFPLWKKILASPSPIDWEKTKAYVSDLSTVKSYSYGGIRLARKIGDPPPSEALISEIINMLREIRDPNTSVSLVKWACRREDLYHGQYLEKYPEILLELKEGYGLGWDLGGELYSTGEIHNIQPGAHKLDSPVFLIHGITPRPIVRHTATLMDLTPTILDLLGVENSFDYDGRSIFKESKCDG